MINWNSSHAEVFRYFRENSEELLNRKLVDTPEANKTLLMDMGNLISEAVSLFAARATNHHPAWPPLSTPSTQQEAPVAWMIERKEPFGWWKGNGVDLDADYFTTDPNNAIQFVSDIQACVVLGLLVHETKRGKPQGTVERLVANVKVTEHIWFAHPQAAEQTDALDARQDERRWAGGKTPAQKSLQTALQDLTERERSADPISGD